MVKVQYRYEHFSKEGKVFTDWIDKKSFITEQEAKKFIKERPKVFNKLKYEYRICEANIH